MCWLANWKQKVYNSETIPNVIIPTDLTVLENIDITDQDVADQLSGLSISKSYGPDGLGTRQLKERKPVIVEASQKCFKPVSGKKLFQKHGNRQLWFLFITRGLSTGQLRCLIIHWVWYTAQRTPNDLDLTFHIALGWSMLYFSPLLKLLK